METEEDPRLQAYLQRNGMRPGHRWVVRGGSSNTDDREGVLMVEPVLIPNQYEHVIINYAKNSMIRFHIPEITATEDDMEMLYGFYVERLLEYRVPMNYLIGKLVKERVWPAMERTILKGYQGE